MISYEVEGPPGAPVLVLCSSLGATAVSWTAQREALRGELRVVTVDTRGHGRSPVPPGPYTVDTLALDVLEVLDDLGVPSASVAGVSLGGAVAQWLAAHAPDRIDTLMLICTSARFGDPEPWHDRAATVRTEGAEAVADAVVARWFTEPWAQAHPARVRSARDMIASTPAEGYAACCEAIAAWDSDHALDTIAVPTLILAGAQDPATPPSHAQVLAAGIPSARLTILDPGAHVVTLERPELVTDLMRDHVHAHVRRPARTVTAQ